MSTGPAMDPGGGQRRGRDILGGGQALQVDLDGLIAGGELTLTGVEEFQILLQDEDVLGPIVAGQRGNDLRMRGAAPIVPMTSELLGVAMARDNVPENLRPVTPVMSLTTSGNCTFICTKAFCMRWMYCLRLDQAVSMAEIGAERDNPVGGAKTPAQQADAVEVAEPLAIGHVALAAGDVLHVPRIDEEDVQPPGLKDVVDRNPVDPGGFHRDAGDTAGDQPVGEAEQIARERFERLDRRRTLIRRHRDIMLRRSAIDPRDMRIDAVQHGGRPAGLAGATATIVFHRTLLHTARKHPGTGRRHRNILPNGITRVATARVTSDAAVRLPRPRS